MGNAESMFAGIENLREGLLHLLREIDQLKAENEALKGHVMGLQEQVEQAKRCIESFESATATATATYDDRVGDGRMGRMGRILPHDRTAAEAEGRKKKGGL